MRLKKSVSRILIIALLVIVGVGVGIFLGKPDLFFKEKPKEEAPTTEKVKEYQKPKAKTSYTLLKEDYKEYELNGQTLHYLAYYYKNNDRIMKEVYFEENNVVQPFAMTLRIEDSEESYIEKDINESAKTQIIKDVGNSDRYLVYTYRLEFELGPEGDMSVEDAHNLLIVSVKGDVLFKKTTAESMSTDFLVLDSNTELEDRTYYTENGEYILYRGASVDDVPSNVDMKEDHFYSLEEDENCNALDYKYTITNGELVKILLKQYDPTDEHFQQAGASC